MLIVAGTITTKMGPVLRTIYDQMLEPKWVIAMGACSSSGGIFDTYSVLQGIDEIMPVDVYVPGCPPIPEGLIHAILHLQHKIENNLERKTSERPSFDDAMNAMSYRKGVGHDIKANFVVTPDYVKEQQKVKEEHK
jgi:NADH-quinone oxidoreductase subunit B